MKRLRPVLLLCFLASAALAQPASEALTDSTRFEQAREVRFVASKHSKV